MQTLGTRLLELRKRAQLSRQELAELADLKAQSHIGLIETGKRRSPQASTLIPLARVLGTNVDYLLFGAGEPPSDRVLSKAVSRARAAANESQKPAANG